MPSPSSAFADSEAKIARLRELWNARDPNGKPTWSSRDIADKVGASKNAVIGWILRARKRGDDGFMPRENPAPRGRDRKPLVPKPPKPTRLAEGARTLPTPSSLASPAPVVSSPANREARPAPQPVTIARISNIDCAWLFGDSDRSQDWTRCTNKAVFGKPYCEACCKRAYTTRKGPDEDGDRPGA